ncbi:RDD domain containing protein [Desulforamulus reducens MI-1]|uniref:RDD domain containing protein n=1 Tax=Desulforamulus reducens (strain ATCC BAA-1160 / DSM 100696 / MI-1) TaxID=349161 RepID=A4J1P4_DESRM|nr:RDD family protein [Desulforamulus reducens]ABO48997.1 RDD domain containing protein [Desulforamulus reducens MI-1]
MNDVSYASPFERLIARIIDKVVITLPVYLWFGTQNNQRMLETIGGGILLVTIVLLNLLWDGQTVGKRVMKIKIDTANGDKLHLGHYLLREFSFTIYPVYLLTYPVIKTVWMFWMLTTMVLILMYGRGIHDMLARTMVVKTNGTLATTKELNKA